MGGLYARACVRKGQWAVRVPGKCCAAKARSAAVQAAAHADKVLPVPCCAALCTRGTATRPALRVWFPPPPCPPSHTPTYRQVQQTGSHSGPTYPNIHRLERGRSRRAAGGREGRQRGGALLGRQRRLRQGAGPGARLDFARCCAQRRGSGQVLSTSPARQPCAGCVPGMQAAPRGPSHRALQSPGGPRPRSNHSLSAAPHGAPWPTRSWAPRASS